MKKLLLIIGLTLLLALPAQAASTFTDVFGSHRNADAIEYLYDEEIVQGYDDGTYRPDNTINRAEFTKIVMGAVETVDTADKSLGDTDLSDMEDGAWYVPFIRRAIERDMIQGYPDKTFRPADEINFVEASKIIMIAFDFPPEEADVWYEPYVEELAIRDAIPTTITKFDQKITRGEMSEIIYRLLEEVTTEESQDLEDLEVTVSEEDELIESMRQFAFEHINEIRAEHGKQPLVMNELLNDIALAHSKDMAFYIKEMSHAGSLGEQSHDRIKQGKVPDIETHEYTYLPFPDDIGWSGENVGRRYITYFGNDVERAIVDQHEWFMDEPVDELNHRTTMLSTFLPFSEIGIGIYLDDSGIVWITEDYISAYGAEVEGGPPTYSDAESEQMDPTDDVANRYMITVNGVSDPEGSDVYFNWSASCGVFWVSASYTDDWMDAGIWSGNTETEIEWRDYDGVCTDPVNVWINLSDNTLKSTDFTYTFTP
jgi:uncharacterized protein YkwD